MLACLTAAAGSEDMEVARAALDAINAPAL